MRILTFENYKPRLDAVEDCVNKIYKDFTIEENKLIWWEPDTLSKSVLIDDKRYYLTGPLANKTRLVNVLTNHYKYEDENIHIPSLRKAIKIWFDENIN